MISNLGSLGSYRPKAGLCRCNCHLFLNCENCDLSAAGNWRGVWASLVLACLVSQQDVYQGMCKIITNVEKQNKKRDQNKYCQRYFGVMRRQDGMRWALYS